MKVVATSFIFQLLDSVLLTQTQITAGAGGGDMEAMISDLSDDILHKLPDVFDVLYVEKKYPTEYTQSMNTVLRQVMYTSFLFFFIDITNNLCDFYFLSELVYILKYLYS